jgi:hypothetical protein
MPLEHYPQAGFELLDDRVPIWRFMKMSTFTRFVEPGSLYFRRADLFDDENEGLPLQEYVREVAANMGPGTTFEDTWENLKQDRQASFVSCWTLDESLHMWEKFAPQGVAVKTQCGLLKAALNAKAQPLKKYDPLREDIAPGEAEPSDDGVIVRFVNRECVVRRRCGDGRQGVESPQSWITG